MKDFIEIKIPYELLNPSPIPDLSNYKIIKIIGIKKEDE